MKTKQSLGPAPAGAAGRTLAVTEFKKNFHTTLLWRYMPMPMPWLRSGLLVSSSNCTFFFLKVEGHVAMLSHLYVADTCCHLSANSPGRQLCRQLFALSAQEWKNERADMVWGLNSATSRTPEARPFLTLGNRWLGLIFECAICRSL